MKESDLETKCCDFVTSLGGKNIKLNSQSGLPDRLHLLPDGLAVFVEYKHPNKKGRRSDLQMIYGAWLEQNHHYYMKCDNYVDFKNFLFTAVVKHERGIHP